MACSAQWALHNLGEGCFPEVDDLGDGGEVEVEVVAGSD